MVSFILPGNSATGGYNVANSLRFDDGNPDSLNKTIGTSTNTKIWTCSFWWKAGQGGSQQQIFSVTNGNSDSTFFQIQYRDNQEIRLNGYNTTWLTTNRKFRDYSAWYSVVVVADSTQGTASNRLKLYINGTEETSFATDNRSSISLNQTWGINLSSQPHYIGSEGGTGSGVSGYLSEFVFIDGQALDPTSFGEFDEDSPTIWKPKDVSGLTFGNNGFHLDFENASSLGADVSGNSNNFTVNNLTSVDQSTDTCTNNFATMNPLANKIANATFSEGNLKIAMSSNKGGNISTIGFTTGKWYAEMKIVSIPTDERWHWGIIPHDNYVSDDPINTGNDGIMISAFNATIYANNGSGHTIISNFFGNSTSAFDSFSGIMGLAIDATSSTKTIAMSKDGAWITGTGTTDSSFSNALKVDISTAFARYPSWHIGTGTGTTAGNGVFSVNFGSPEFSISSGNSDANGFGNFEYAVPSGYFSLCTKNLAEFG
jgi:hypothetical protein